MVVLGLVVVYLWFGGFAGWCGGFCWWRFSLGGDLGGWFCFPMGALLIRVWVGGAQCL